MNETTTKGLSPETVKVGDGVTEQVGSDRRAGTVTWVSPSGKTLRFTTDSTKALPGHGMFDAHQEYEYTSHEEVVRCLAHSQCEGGKEGCYLYSNIATARWNAKRQKFVPSGSRSGLFAGRHAYNDPSF